MMQNAFLNKKKTEKIKEDLNLQLNRPPYPKKNKNKKSY